mmetsp:Transcript_13679/g.22351  ORF Transcript_13679/g.22351 Transcript_13679/m.22351 type:complete len:82 (-) Transcript_13679:677-922(-)
MMNKTITALSVRDHPNGLNVSCLKTITKTTLNFVQLKYSDVIVVGGREMASKLITLLHPPSSEYFVVGGREKHWMWIATVP